MLHEISNYPIYIKLIFDLSINRLSGEVFERKMVSFTYHVGGSVRLNYLSICLVPSYRFFTLKSFTSYTSIEYFL